MKIKLTTAKSWCLALLVLLIWHCGGSGIACPPPQPTVQFTQTSISFSEGAVYLNVAVEISNWASGVSVPYTVTPGTATPGDAIPADYYCYTANPLTFPDYTHTAEPIRFIIWDDSFDEVDETFTITLGTPTGAILGSNTQCSITITDNDNPPTVSITPNSSGSESVSPVSFTVSLSGTSGKTVTVPFSWSGTANNPADYSPQTSSPVVFTPGQTAQYITFTVNNDAIDEDNQTVICTLGTPTNATLGTNPATYTINDDDAAPTVQFEHAVVEASENGANWGLNIVVTGQTEKTITVPFSLNANSTAGVSDFTTVSSSPITITPGNAPNYLFATINTDAVDEPIETLIYDLGTPTNATLGSRTQGRFLIMDGDATALWRITDTNLDDVLLMCNNGDLYAPWVVQTATPSTDTQYQWNVVNTSNQKVALQEFEGTYKGRLQVLTLSRNTQPTTSSLLTWKNSNGLCVASIDSSGNMAVLGR